MDYSETSDVILVIRTTGSHIGVVKNKVSWGTLMANNLITPHDGNWGLRLLVCEVEEIDTFVQ